MIPLYCENEHIISDKTVNAMHIKTGHKTKGPREGHKTKGPLEGHMTQRAHRKGTNTKSPQEGHRII